MTLEPQVVDPYNRAARFTRSGTIFAAAVATLLLASCGRLGFDPTGAGHDANDGTPDSSGIHDADVARVPGPALVQDNTGFLKTPDGTSVNSLTVTLPGSTTAGNLLVMIGGNTGGTLGSLSKGLPAVTGGGVTSWTLAYASDSYANLEIWYGVVTTSSSSGVTIASGDPLVFRLHVSEWSGIDTTQEARVCDQASAQARTSDGQAFAPEIVTTRTDLVVFGVSDYYPGGFTTPTEGPWTMMKPIEATGDSLQYAWHQTMPAGTHRPMVIDNTAASGRPRQQHWVAAIAAFKALP